MTEAAQLALINNLPQILTAFGVLLTALIGFATFLLTLHVKKATNSMKDALVAAAKKEGEAVGKAQEQAQPTTQSVPITGDSRRSTDQ